MVGCICDDVHRHEANYHHVVHVDYHDYDYEHYWRFGRVEKQLAGQESFEPTTGSEPGGGFLYLSPLQGRSSGRNRKSNRERRP